MVNISIAEFLVYGMLTYSSILVMIFSVKGISEERTRTSSLIHVVFLLPGLICAPILAEAGPNITISSETIQDLNSTETWTDNSNIVLSNQTWVLVHMMIFFVLLIYIIRQILLFLMAPA